MYKPPDEQRCRSHARLPPRHGSELERNERLHGLNAAVIKVPNAAERAAKREQTRGSARLWHAAVQFGSRQPAHLLVQRLSETGWDWHMWVQAGWSWARYGLAETAENAREQAEQALVGLMCSNPDGNVPCSLHCQLVLFPQRSEWKLEWELALEHETLRPSRAMPSAGTQAARLAAFSTSTRTVLAVELRKLRARLRPAHERAAAALDAGVPGRRPGEALQRFLAADAEVAAIVRRIKNIQAFTERWKYRPRESAGQAN